MMIHATSFRGAQLSGFELVRYSIQRRHAVHTFHAASILWCSHPGLPSAGDLGETSQCRQIVLSGRSGGEGGCGK